MKIAIPKEHEDFECYIIKHGFIDKNDYMAYSYDFVFNIKSKIKKEDNFTYEIIREELTDEEKKFMLSQVSKAYMLLKKERINKE